MIFMASALAPLVLFVGTFTQPGDSTPGGIYSVPFDPGTGSFGVPRLAVATVRPTFLALHPDGRRLYATTDLQEYHGSSVDAPDAFFLDPGSGELESLPRQVNAGLPMIHAVVDPTGRTLMEVSYRGRRIVSYRLDGNGVPSEQVSCIENTGPVGPQSSRQEGSHPHSVTLSPDGRQLYVCDLGLDRVYSYTLDPATARLAATTPPFTQVRPGTGPRHSKISDDGKFLYVLGELNGTIAVFSRDSKSGALHEIQNISTLPEGFKGSNTSAEIRIHPNGGFVYCSNRGDNNSIAVFRRDGRDGHLTPTQSVASGGVHPRNFAISPDGSWLICANRDSSNLVAFRIDPQTGQLTPSGNQVSIPKPTCVLFTPP